MNYKATSLNQPLISVHRHIKYGVLSRILGKPLPIYGWKNDDNEQTGWLQWMRQRGIISEIWKQIEPCFSEFINRETALVLPVELSPNS
jgi:hypothetical protein